MKVQLTSLFLLAPLALASAACRSAPEPPVIAEVLDTSTLPSEVQGLLVAAAEAEKPLLIDFHAEW